MTTELLQRAASDNRLSHGAVRVLVLMTLNNADLSHQGQVRIKKALDACSLRQWVMQLRNAGYLPPPKLSGVAAMYAKRNT